MARKSTKNRSSRGLGPVLALGAIAFFFGMTPEQRAAIAARLGM